MGAHRRRRPDIVQSAAPAETTGCERALAQPRRPLLARLWRRPNTGATLVVRSEASGRRAAMRRLKCLLRRHDWYSTYDRETKMIWWECRICAATKRGSGTDQTVKGIFGGLS